MQGSCPEQRGLTSLCAKFGLGAGCPSTIDAVNSRSCSPLLLLLALSACGGARAQGRESSLAKPRALESSRSSTPLPPAPASASAREEEPETEAPTPLLKVVRLTPDDAPAQRIVEPEQRVVEAVDDEPIDAAGVRPRLVLRGAPIEEPAARALPSAPAGEAWGGEGPRPSALDPRARQAYQQAYQTYQERGPRAGLDAFAAFVLKYPDHPYVEQASFWRAECYAKLGDRARAVEHFEGVVRRYAGTEKARAAEERLVALRGKSEERAQ